jgi:hypothetical protein
MNEVLKFENLVFEEDLPNLTVRRGTKWSGLKGKVYVGDVDGEIQGVAKILCTKTMKFEDIKKEDLELEHDPKCRDYEGLLEVMQEVYEDFDVYEIVTLVYFKILI